MAKVSIIIPTYNVELFLDECLESIQRQTLQDIEIICVNDGSTDHSLEIIKKYAEKQSTLMNSFRNTVLTRKTAVMERL